MKIFEGARLVVLVLVVTAISLAGAARVGASTNTFTGSPDALVRMLQSATPVPTPTPSPVPTSPVPPTRVPPTPVPPTPVTPTRVPRAPAVPLVLTAPPPVAAVDAGLPDHVVRGQAALARVRYDLSSVGYTISFHPGDSNHLGLTFTRRRHIEIYVRPSMSEATLAYIIGHEMGHAVDHIRNTNEDRQRWSTARGISPNGAWWPVGVGSDFATPAGDFAECFASWAAGSPSHSAWGSCAPAMTLMAQLANG